ncbi:MAG: phenylacetate--CoA ligase [Clostridiales bacterium]|jgi:phenylacetate-CoA ligase|nr:phenylacetate--CoA ligase [Clostridiales bacterium]
MYWNQEIETMPRESIVNLQGERLAACIRRVYDNVKPYREKMIAAGVTPEDIKTVEDLRKLPFTYKQDLRDNYPFGLFATPLDDVVRIHASSGTTGKQTVVGYTQNDLNIWDELMARTLTAAGGSRKSVIHVAYGYGLFTGGLGAHGGAQRIGAATVPVSVGNTKRQIQIMLDFGSSLLCCTPSYALHLAEAIEEAGIDKSALKLKSGCFGAEPWTGEMRSEIEARLNIKAFDIYGLSEVMGPGVSFECSAQSGLHISEDHFIAEIINPDTGEPLPYGESGELVFTCITKEALPLIRYRTRDVSSLIATPCACGRTHVRMTKPAGRTDDMLIIRGVNVFPSQIESVLLNFGDVAPHYIIIVDRVDNLDTLEVQVEMSPAFFSDEVRKIEELESNIRREIESVLGLAARIRLVEPKSIERSEGKAKRVIDKRKLI